MPTGSLLVMIKIICDTCGTEFSRRHNNIARGARARYRVFCSALCRQWRQQSPEETYLRDLVRTALKQTTRRSKLSKIEHSLRPTDAIALLVRQGKRCAVTGVALDWRNVNPLLRPSLDRIDSDVGYQLNNVRWVCRGYNMLKLNHSDFLTLQALTTMSSGVTQSYGC